MSPLVEWLTGGWVALVLVGAIALWLVLGVAILAAKRLFAHFAGAFVPRNRRL